MQPGERTRQTGGLPWRATGFSLLELIIVLLVLATTVTIGINRWGGSRERLGVDAAVTRLKADIELARATALATGSSRQVTFTAGTGQYVIPLVNGPTMVGTDYRVDLGAEPYGCKISGVEVGGDLVDTLIFDGRGQLTGASGTGKGEVIVEGGSRLISLEIDAATGMVSID